MKYCIGLLALMGSTLSVAADGGRLTENDFLALLTDEHPAVVALTERMATAEGERRSARVMNPEIGFDREAPDAAQQSIFWLRWQPPLDGRRGLRQDAAEAGVQAAENAFHWAKLQLRVELRGVYAEWVQLVERRDLLVAHVAVMQRLGERARLRADTGEESGLDARRLVLALVEVQGELARAKAALIHVKAQVQVVHPDLQPSVQPVRSALPDMAPKVDWSDRPDIMARRFEVQRAMLEKRLSGRYLEFPELMAGWTRIDAAGGRSDGPVLGVRWSVPLFDRNPGERAEAARRIGIAKARLTLANARAEAELEAAYEVYAQLRTVALELAAVSADAAGLIESATTAFRVGESTLTDLLQTLRSVLSSQTAALDLHYNALEAHRFLEASGGRTLSIGGTE